GDECGLLLGTCLHTWPSHLIEGPGASAARRCEGSGASAARRWTRRTCQRRSRPLLRRVDDAQHLDRVVHDMIDDAVGIAGHDALARAGYRAMPSHKRELSQAVRGVEDRPDHAV